MSKIPVFVPFFRAISLTLLSTGNYTSNVYTDGFRALAEIAEERLPLERAIFSLAHMLGWAQLQSATATGRRPRAVRCIRPPEALAFLTPLNDEFLNVIILKHFLFHVWEK